LDFVINLRSASREVKIKMLFRLCLVLVSTLLTSPLYAANPDDLAKLTLQPAKQKTLDLSNADLRAYQFSSDKIDLKGANLSHANLTNVNLEKMNLTGADLSYAILTNVKLSGADLSYANLSYADLTNATLTHVNLSNSLVRFAVMVGANFQQANLTKADFTCANFNNANLTKANFSETNISSATFINTLTTDILNYESVIDDHVNCAG